MNTVRGQDASGSPLTLGERIASITGKVGPIVPTGNNQFSKDKKAMSVMDVEEALRPLLAEAGVITNWSVVNASQIDSGQRLWQLNFHVTVSAADNPEDKIEADWMDIGTSPTAAASFAVKGYYRRLFHLADADDEGTIPPAGDAKKPATLRKYDAQIKKTWSPDPPDQAAEAERSELTGAAPAMTPPPLETGELDLTDLFALGRTLRTPATNLQIKNEVAEHGVEGVRRRLILAHARDHGPACEHVAQLAGLARAK